MRRFIAVGDIHGDCHSSEAMAVLFSFTKVFKPHLKVMLGDLYDCRALRRGASEHDLAHPLDADFDYGNQFLSDWKPDVFLLGNHDVRLWRVSVEESHDSLRKRAADQQIQQIEKICRKVGCDIYPYETRLGVHREGRLSFIHGFHHGPSALKKSVDIYDSVVLGHNHTPQTLIKSALIPKHGFMTGCMCRVDQSYNSTHTAKLAHGLGFVYGFLHEDGGYEVFHATKGPSGWLLPTEWKKY